MAIFDILEIPPPKTQFNPYAPTNESLNRLRIIPSKTIYNVGQSNTNAIYNNKINDIVDINDIINKPCLSTWFEFLRGNLVDIVVVHC